MKHIYAALIAVCLSGFLHAAADSSESQEKPLPPYLSTQFIGVVRSAFDYHVPVATSILVKDKRPFVQSYFGFVSANDQATAHTLADLVATCIQEKSAQFLDGNIFMYDRDILKTALSRLVGKDVTRLAQIMNSGEPDIQLFNFSNAGYNGAIRIVSLQEQIDNKSPYTKAPTHLQAAIIDNARDVKALCNQGIMLPADHMRLLHELYLCHQEDTPAAERLAALHAYAKALYNDAYKEARAQTDHYKDDMASSAPDKIFKIPVLIVDHEKLQEHMAQIMINKDKDSA